MMAFHGELGLRGNVCASLRTDVAQKLVAENACSADSASNVHVRIFNAN